MRRIRVPYYRPYNFYAFVQLLSHKYNIIADLIIKLHATENGDSMSMFAF